MALMRCRRCTTRFAVGLPYCPQCTSTDHEEDGEMPKITKHGGPSNAADAQAPAAAPVAAAAPPQEAAEAQEATDAAAAGEDDASDGYEALTVDELRDQLDARGLGYATRDRRAELVAKLRAADAASEDGQG